MLQCSFFLKVASRTISDENWSRGSLRHTHRLLSKLVRTELYNRILQIYFHKLQNTGHMKTHPARDRATVALRVWHRFFVTQSAEIPGKTAQKLEFASIDQKLWNASSKCPFCGNRPGVGCISSDAKPLVFSTQTNRGTNKLNCAAKMGSNCRCHFFLVTIFFSKRSLAIVHWSVLPCRKHHGLLLSKWH